MARSCPLASSPSPIRRVGLETTTTINLGSALADLGHRVLIVDCDPQANATSGLGVTADQINASIYDVVVLGRPLVEARISPGAEFELIPSTIALAGAEIELVGPPAARCGCGMHSGRSTGTPTTTCSSTARRAWGCSRERGGGGALAARPHPVRSTTPSRAWGSSPTPWSCSAASSTPAWSSRASSSPSTTRGSPSPPRSSTRCAGGSATRRWTRSSRATCGSARRRATDCRSAATTPPARAPRPTPAWRRSSTSASGGGCARCRVAPPSHPLCDEHRRWGLGPPQARARTRARRSPEQLRAAAHRRCHGARRRRRRGPPRRGRRPLRRPAQPGAAPPRLRRGGAHRPRRVDPHPRAAPAHRHRA